MGPRCRALLLSLAALLLGGAQAHAAGFFGDGGVDIAHYDPNSGPSGRIFVGDASGRSLCHYRVNLPAGKNITDLHVLHPRNFGSITSEPLVVVTNGEGRLGYIARSGFDHVHPDGSPCDEGGIGGTFAALAASEGDIPISNDADSFDVTSDARYAVVAGSNSETPVSLVDLEAGAEVDTFAFDGIGTFVATCDDDDSALVLLNGNQLDISQIRRLTIGVGGTLTDTAEVFALAGANQSISKVFSVPGSQVGVALTREFGSSPAARLESFAIPGLQALDSVAIGGLNDLSVAVAPSGNAVYVRSNDDIERFALDPLTGALGDVPSLSIPGVSPVSSLTNFGNALAITSDGARLVASEPAEFPTTEVPTPRVSYFDATTGARLGVFEDAEFVRPTLVSAAPEPQAFALAVAALGALGACARWSRRAP